MYINYIYSVQSRNLHNIEIALRILMNWELSIHQQQRAVQCGLLMFAVYTANNKSLDNAAIYSATATAEKCFSFTSQRVCIQIFQQCSCEAGWLVRLLCTYNSFTFAECSEFANAEHSEFTNAERSLMQNGQSSQTQHARCIRRPFRACKRCVRIHECCIHRVCKRSEFAMQSSETNDVFADRSEFANTAFADRGVHERNFHRVCKR